MGLDAELVTFARNDTEPVGVPKVLVDAFCTVTVSALGADAAPTTANTAVRTTRTARIPSGIKLRLDIRQTLVPGNAAIRRSTAFRGSPDGRGYETVTL